MRLGLEETLQMKKVTAGGVRDSASNVPHRTSYPSPLGPVGLKKYHSCYKDLETTSIYLSSSSSSSFAEEGSTKICGAGIIKAFKKKTCGAPNNTTKSTITSGRSPAGHPPPSSSSSSSRSVSSSVSTPVSVDAFIDVDASNVIQKDRSIVSNVSKKKKKHHRPASSYRRRGASSRPGKILECLLFLETEQDEVKKDNVQQRKMEEEYRYQQQKAVRNEPAKTTGTTPPNTTSEMARKTTNQSQNLQETSSVTKALTPSASSSIVSGSEEDKVVKPTTTHEMTQEAEEEGIFFTFDDNTTVPSCNIVVSKVSSKSFEGEIPHSTPSSSHLAITQKKTPSSITPKRMGLPPRPPMSPSTNLSQSKQKTKRTPLSPLTQSSPTKTSVLSHVNISSYSNVNSCSYETGAGDNDDDDDDDGVVQIDPSVIKSRIAEMKKLQQIQQKIGDHTSDKQSDDVNRDENQPLKGQQSLLIDHSTRSDRAVNAAMVKILKAMAVNVGQDDDDFGSTTSADIGGEDFDGRLSTLLDISTRRGARSCILTQNADFEDIVGDENCPKEHSEDPQPDDNDKSSTEIEDEVFDRIQNKASQDEDTSCPRAEAVNDKETIASLKQERESYKSEAVALHEEIEQIKNQLAELRRHLFISTNGPTGTVPPSSAVLLANKKYQQYPDVKNCQTEDSYMGDDSIQNSFLQCQSKSERTERNEVSASKKAIPLSLSPIIGSVSTSSSSSSSISDDDCSDDSVQSETLHSQYPLPYGIQPRGY